MSSRLRESHAWVILIAAVLLLFTAQLWNLRLAAAPYTDEGVYAELGRLIFSGYVPHRDFFLAHMPLLPSLIGAGLEAFQSMYVLRVIYLFLNCLGVLLLFRFLVTAWRVPMAALVACLFYATYHEMVHHDFRFLAVRELANLFLIGILLNSVRRTRASTPLDVVLCVMGVFTFLPFFVEATLIYAAFALNAADGAARLRSIRAYAVPLVVSASSVLLYFALVPAAFEQVVLFQRERPFLPYSVRLSWIMEYSSHDLLFYGLGLAGLLLAVAVLAQHRLLSLAMLGILILSVVAGAGFFPHYLVAAAPALAWGVSSTVAFFWKLLTPRLMPLLYLGGAALVSVHLVTVLPSLSREWSSNAHPGFYEVVQAIRASGGPVLAFEPIYAVESGVPTVYHFYQDVRSLDVMQKRLTLHQMRALEAQACTILIDPFSGSRAVLQREMLETWQAKYDTSLSNWWGAVLETRHPHCQPR